MEKFITTMQEQPFMVLLIIIALFYAIREGYELIMWWKARADGYHKIKSEEEDFHRQVCDIACTSQAHTETLKQLGEAINGFSEKLDGINERLDNADRERKEDTIASGRATLYHLYEEFSDKDTLSSSEYETFDEIARRYLAAGGNSVFKDKIIPEIRAKKIHDE